MQAGGGGAGANQDRGIQASHSSVGGVLADSHLFRGFFSKCWQLCIISVGFVYCVEALHILSELYIMHEGFA